jgi:RecA-family ATPase
VTFDELNPPPADSPDVYGSVGMNGAEPPPPATDDARDNPIIAPIPGADPLQQGKEFVERSTGPVNGTKLEPEDEALELWTPRLAKHYDPPRQRWAVEDFFPHNEVCLFTGEGDLGKSTMLQQLQVSSALVQPWFGMEVTKGPTLGIYCEDGEPQIWRRFKNSLASHGADWGDADGKMLWAALGAASVDMTLFHFDGEGGVAPGPGYELLVRYMGEAKPSLCILDSLYNFYPYNINDTYLAKAFVDNLARLGRQRNCTFILNSHPTKSGIDEGTGQHGARNWHNAVRARAYVEVKDKTDPDSPRIVSHRKNNYGRKLPPFGVRYDLDQHVYVLDEEATEDAKSLSVQQQKALKLLKKAIDEAGEIPPGSNHIPANVRCVRTSLWRAYCEQGSITQSDKPDTRRTAFNRAAEVLDNRDKIGVWGDWVWEART